jgi:uncharacterized membrane protein
VVVERLLLAHAMDVRSVGDALFYGAVHRDAVLMMRGRHGGRSSYPLDILKERFARGEITQAEYEERRRVLEA